MRWVRPALTTLSNFFALRVSERSRPFSAGTSVFVAWSSAARCTALGKTSFDDWPLLTSSLAWTLPPASAAMTSLAFMFDEVPEPVWNTSIGNWSSCSPFATASAALAIASATCGSRRSSSALAVAAGGGARGRGVGARRGALGGGEPVDHRGRDGLAGDGEVVDGLLGLAAV